MKSETDKITQDDLLAYVDGALDVSKHAAVEAFLAQHPASDAEVKAWRRQNQSLHALYGHLAKEPVPAGLDVRRMARDHHAASRNWRRMAAVAALCLIIGGGGGLYAARFGLFAYTGSAALVAEAVAAHALYTREVVHPVEVRADESEHLKAWLSKRLDRGITLPDLRSEGLQLIGGRLLPAGKQPAAQLMYEDEAGRRVTLYIIPAPAGRETSFRFTSLDRLEALIWTDDAISCAIVGELPRDKLEQIATHAYRQLG